LRDLRPVVLLLAVAAALVVAAPALADGDPASDYLITQPAYLPFGSKISTTTAGELTQMLETAKKKGYEVRVALIANKTDLGAVPILFGQPQRYADFLGQELVYYYKGPVLVVMPQGYGIFQNGKPLKADKATLAKLAKPASADGNGLALSAEDAVRALAAHRGITVEARPVASSGSSKNRDRIEIAAAVILVAAIVLAVRLLLSRRRRHAGNA
jgi:hypothetical protein